MTSFHFLSPGDQNTGQKVLSKICDMIRSNNTLNICVAYFTHATIADAIIQRSKSRLPTKIILNLADLLRPSGVNSSEFRASSALVDIFTFLGTVRFPLNLCIEMKTLGREQNGISTMHHKFIIGDSEVGFGSMNFTTNSMINNYENFCFTKEQLFHQAFVHQFSKLWEIGQEMFAQNGEIRIIECPKCGYSEGVDFESYGMLCVHCQHKFIATS